MEDTKQRILEKSLELFSAKGYDAVSVGEIAKAVGIKAPSLYNHFPSKQAIFDAIVESTAAHYEKDTGRTDIHVQNVKQDCPTFSHISEQALADKVRQIFLYSLHDKTISQFRRMMTLEQFRSPELAALFSERYVDRMISYHAGIFRSLIAGGEIRDEDPDTLAWMYVSPIIVLLSVCDRQPERESESLAKLDAHVKLFFRTFNIERGENEYGRWFCPLLYRPVPLHLLLGAKGAGDCRGTWNPVQSHPHHRERDGSECARTRHNIRIVPGWEVCDPEHSVGQEIFEIGRRSGLNKLGGILSCNIAHWS